MFLRDRAPPPQASNLWVVLVGAGLGFLVAKTHYQGGWKSLKHAIAERNLFIIYGELAKGLNERAWEEEDDPDLMDYYNEAELEWNQLPDDRKKYW